MRKMKLPSAVRRARLHQRAAHVAHLDGGAGRRVPDVRSAPRSRRTLKLTCGAGIDVPPLPGICSLPQPEVKVARASASKARLGMVRRVPRQPFRRNGKLRRIRARRGSCAHAASPRSARATTSAVTDDAPASRSASAQAPRRRSRRGDVVHQHHPPPADPRRRARRERAGHVLEAVLPVEARLLRRVAGPLERPRRRGAPELARDRRPEESRLVVPAFGEAGWVQGNGHDHVRVEAPRARGRPQESPSGVARSGRSPILEAAERGSASGPPKTPKAMTGPGGATTTPAAQSGQSTARRSSRWSQAAHAGGASVSARVLARAPRRAWRVIILSAHRHERGPGCVATTKKDASGAGRAYARRA